MRIPIAVIITRGQLTPTGFHQEQICANDDFRENNLIEGDNSVQNDVSEG